MIRPCSSPASKASRQGICMIVAETGRETVNESSRCVWTQHSNELAEFYRICRALCTAVAPEHQHRASFDLVGGATYVYTLYGTKFFSAWGRFRIAAKSVGSTGGLRRLHCWDPCDHCHGGTCAQRQLGNCGGVALQCLGFCRSNVRIL